MSTAPGEAPGPQAATPRLCDAQGRNIVAPIPRWVTGGLAVFGLFAIATTGFLGYYPAAEEPAYNVDGPFHHPWLLFAFFCTLAATPVALVFREKKYRKQRSLSLAVIVVSAVTDVVLYEAIVRKRSPLELLTSALRFLADHLPTFGFFHSPLTYVILNYIIIAGLVVDMAVRWIRHLRRSGKRSPERAPASGPLGISPETIDEVQELAAGDFVVRAVGILVVAIFMLVVVPNLVQAGGSRCEAITATGECSNGPATLALLDLVLGLATLVPGLVFLLINASSRTLANVQAKAEGAKVQAEAEGAKEKMASRFRQIGQDTAGAVIEPLASAIRESIVWLLRLIRINIRPVLHFLAWAGSMFLGIGAAGMLALVILDHLHSSHSTVQSSGLSGLVSVLVNSLIALTTSPSPDGINALLALAASIGLAVLAVCGVVVSMAVLAEDRGVVADVLHFLRLTGFVFVILYCLFAFALSASGGLVWLFYGCFSAAPPFDQSLMYCGSPRAVALSLGPMATLSFVLLIVFAMMYLLKRRTRGAASA